MNTFPMFNHLFVGAVACWLLTATLLAKPPVPPVKKSTPEPAATSTPATAPSPEATVNPLARWLLQQDGGKDAILLPLAEVIRAATGKNVLPVDAGNPADAAVIAKLSNVMDRVLPGMNKPESPAHVVTRVDEIAAFFEDALRAFAATVPGLSCPPAVDEASVAMHTASGFPAVRILDAASGKSFYLGVTLYPTGGRETAVRALHFQGPAASAWITEPGSCLLVAIESNGKTGKEIAFLNWELLDLAKLSVRVVTTFQATQGDVHPPGSVLNDGRKGRD